MKKLLAAALAIFIIFMSYVFIGGFLQKQATEDEPLATSNTTSNTSTTTPTNTSATFTPAQVATHSSTSDCWLIINNQVYNVTTFLAEHPGGASTIIPYCGKEATQAFDTQDRGRGGGHSTQASDMLATYKVGSLSN